MINHTRTWLIGLVSPTIAALSLGCGNAVVTNDVMGDYSARSEVPRVVENVHRCYLDGFRYIGSIKVEGSRETALKEAAKLGADRVVTGSPIETVDEREYSVLVSQRTTGDLGGTVVSDWENRTRFEEKTYWHVSLYREDPEGAVQQGVDLLAELFVGDMEWDCSPRIISEYLEKGIDPNKVDAWGLPLFWRYTLKACKGGPEHLSLGMMQYPNVSAPGFTERMQEALLSGAHLLLEAGAEPSIIPSDDSALSMLDVPLYNREFDDIPTVIDILRYYIVHWERRVEQATEEAVTLEEEGTADEYQQAETARAVYEGWAEFLRQYRNLVLQHR